jgi:hypothetical protein
MVLVLVTEVILASGYGATTGTHTLPHSGSADAAGY